MRQSPHAGISCENDLGQLMVVGTHEAKGLVLGGMEPGEAYGYTALHRELLVKPQGDSPVPAGHVGNPIDYCRLSLGPAGCVERVPGDTEQFAITETGEREGKAFVGHVLALSLDAGEVGLRSLYGMARTANGKASRPPLDRVRIFRRLLQGGDLQTSDVQRLLGGSSNNARDNVRWLDRAGIVDYEGIDSKDAADHLTYELPKGLELRDSSGGIRQRIVDTLRELTAEEDYTCTLTGLIDELTERYPEVDFASRGRRANVIGAMNELAAADRITKNNLARRSTITLRESARPVVARSVAIADGMLEGGEAFLEEGREQLRVVLDDEERVRALVSKAFAASPEANGLPLGERIARVTASLKDQSGTLSELWADLRASGMTERSVGDTLYTMRRRGLAEAELTPGERENRWALAA